MVIVCKYWSAGLLSAAGVAVGFSNQGGGVAAGDGGYRYAAGYGEDGEEDGADEVGRVDVEVAHALLQDDGEELMPGKDYQGVAPHVGEQR